MKFNYIVNRLSNTFFNVITAISKDTFDVEKKCIEKKIFEQIKIKGFRQGKIPIDLLSFHYKTKIFKHTKEKLIHDTFEIIKNINYFKPIHIALIRTRYKTEYFIYEINIEIFPKINFVIPTYKKFTVIKYKLNEKHIKRFTALFIQRFHLFQNIIAKKLF